jgi:DNA-binding response OmpR family regulator
MDNRKHILIVDSNTTIREKLHENFIKDGFKASAASGEEEAKEILLRDRPDLILSEILLDDCDGVQFCKDIKDNPDFSNVPLVVLTSANDHVIEIKSLRNGADEFFVKRNITRQELMLKIQVLLERFSNYHFLKRSSCFTMQGSLEGSSLKKLIRMFHVARETGCLLLCNDYNEAELIFREGELINAVLGTNEGLDAIFKIDKLKDAFFGFDAKTLNSVNATIDQTTETILSLLED